MGYSPVSRRCVDCGCLHDRYEGKQCFVCRNKEMTWDFGCCDLPDQHRFIDKRTNNEVSVCLHCEDVKEREQLVVRKKSWFRALPWMQFLIVTNCLTGMGLAMAIDRVYEDKLYEDKIVFQYIFPQEPDVLTIDSNGEFYWTTPYYEEMTNER